MPAGFDSSSAFFSLAAFAFGVAAVFGDFFPALEPFLPECPLRLLGVDDPPRLLLLGLKLLGLFMDTHQKPPLILTGTDRRTHTHTPTHKCTARFLALEI